MFTVKLVNKTETKIGMRLLTQLAFQTDQMIHDLGYDPESVTNVIRTVAGQIRELGYDPQATGFIPAEQNITKSR